MKPQLPLILLAIPALLPVAAAAHDTRSLPTVEVTERVRARTTLGADASAQPAPVVVIRADEIAEMNVGHVMDIFRDRTGLVVRHLNQGDVGDDFGLRGFSGGHGVDTAIYVDGVPLNQVNGRTHGLADLNWLNPAMIERIEIIKGPFSARYGNFALGGVVHIITRDHGDGAALQLAAGSYGNAAGTLTLGNAVGVLVGEAFRREGYRENSDGERAALYARASRELGGGQLGVAFAADRRDFGAPGYLPVDEVRAGRLSRRAAVDTSDGGEVEHAQAWVAWSRAAASDWRVDARVYAIVDQRSRYANFGAGQGATLTDIDTLGATLDLERMADRWALACGAHLRRDEGSRRAFRSIRRIPGATTSDRAAETLESGLWAELQWAPRTDFKATFGARWDRFDSEIDNRFNPSASGSGAGDVFSPRAGLAWRPAPWLELYTNRGRGLRSPSQAESSPDTRGARFQALEPFVLDSTDLGLRIATDGGWSAELALYRTDTEGEFVQVAPGEFANLGSTTRDGIEGELRWRGAWLEVYFGASRVDAELVTASAGRALSGVPADTQVAGFTVRRERWVLDTYAQRYGRAPLDPAATAERPAVRSLGARLSRRFEGFDAWLQLAYNPDEDRSETQFLINNRNAFDPLPRTEVQLGISVAF